MNRRLPLDSLLAILTLGFSVLCTSALLIDFWTAPDAYVAAARA